MKTTYSCEYCNASFESGGTCLNHELDCKQKHDEGCVEENFRKYYPKHHKNDTTDLTFCVRCGAPLSETDYAFDVVSSQWVRSSIKSIRPSYKLFDGSHCKDCFLRTYKRIRIILADYESRPSVNTSKTGY